jgi:polar amino acid transport system permease protein
VLAVLVWALARRASAHATYHWDFSIVPRYIPVLLRGVLLTLELTFGCMITGMALGLLVASARMSRVVPLRWATALYIDIMRSTPLLIQLVWLFYCLPIILGLTIPGLPVAVVALTLHMGAYYGEAFRAGIQSIPRAQLEAADVLGLSAFHRMRFVVLPQAFRNVLPVMVTLGILLFKDTSLVSVIGLNDLMNTGQNIALTTYRPLELLTTVGIIYFILVLPATIALRKLEVRLSRHQAVSVS